MFFTLGTWRATALDILNRIPGATLSRTRNKNQAVNNY